MRGLGIEGVRLSLARSMVLLACCVAAALPCAASHTVVDETGRTVTLPDHPHRIVSLVPSITDSVYALGAGDDVVAISDFVKYPEAAMQKPSVGSMLQPSVEKILSFKPDLLLGQKVQNQQAVVDMAARFGIPLYIVDPHGFNGIFKSITDLGIAIGREPQAAALNARLQARVAAVHASVQGRPVVSVFMPVSYDPVVTIGKGSFLTDMIELAGGHSITDDIQQEWPHVSMEAVIARQPRALLMMQGGTITLATLRTRPGWDALPAVKTGTVYFIDKRSSFSSPVAIDALEELAKQLHP